MEDLGRIPLQMLAAISDQGLRHALESLASRPEYRGLRVVTKFEATRCLVNGRQKPVHVVFADPWNSGGKSHEDVFRAARRVTTPLRPMTGLLAMRSHAKDPLIDFIIIGGAINPEHASDILELIRSEYELVQHYKTGS